MIAWTEPLRVAQRHISLLGLAQHLRTAQAWRTFTELHVFAVWDFMSLLKRLQREVTCLDVPWLPAADPQAARFLNELVLAEESDDDGQGGFSDHFSTYRRGMREAGADCAPMDALLDGLRAGRAWQDALRAADVPEAAAQFVATTLKVAVHGEAHEVAAAFFFGRESLLPTLFAELLEGLVAVAPELETLRHYFARHVTLDGEEHGPMAERLLAKLCGGSHRKRAEAEQAAQRSLAARQQLWTQVARAVVG